MTRLLRDQDGVTVVEFAMIAPTLLIAMMGILDLTYTMYTASMVQGAIQKAARDSTIEGASLQQSAIDARVRAAVLLVAPGATVNFTRKAYASYSLVGRPEDYTDVDGDGSCNHGDPYEDANGNGAFDLDRGASGVGGARDAVAYTVTVTYPRFLPIGSLIGRSNTASLTETTILRNQPYAANIRGVPAILACP